MGTSSSNTAGSTSTNMSKEKSTFGRRESNGARRHRRQKKGLVNELSIVTKHALRGAIPPENTIPLGFHVRSLTLVVHGSSSAKTPKARSRRRIRWLVWDPKSRTSIV